MVKNLLNSRKILKTVQILSQNEFISREERIELSKLLANLDVSGLLAKFQKISSSDPFAKKFCKDAIEELERINNE